MIINKTRKTKLAQREVFLKNPFSQGAGLMFKARDSVSNQAWVFVFRKDRRLSITMWFVFFPIDLIFLDENKQVVELKEGLRPLALYRSRKKTSYLIELAAGSIKKSKTGLNDILCF